MFAQDCYIIHGVLQRTYHHTVRSRELTTVFCLEYFKGQSDPCAKDKPETITNLVECCSPSWKLDKKIFTTCDTNGYFGSKPPFRTLSEMCCQSDTCIIQRSSMFGYHKWKHTAKSLWSMPVPMRMTFATNKYTLLRQSPTESLSKQTTVP